MPFVLSCAALLALALWADALPVRLGASPRYRHVARALVAVTALVTLARALALYLGMRTFLRFEDDPLERAHAYAPALALEHTALTVAVATAALAAVGLAGATLFHLRRRANAHKRST